MSAGAELEAPRRGGGGFCDALTFAFGDPEQEVYGTARIGRDDGDASGLAVLFSGGDAVAASVETAVATPSPEWEDLRAAGVRTTVQAPLQAWTVAYEGDGGGFDLRFEACSSPALLAAGEPAANAGGLEGYEQLCTVSGTVRAGGRDVPVRCLGERGHMWGKPDGKRVELTRTISAWLGEDRAVALLAVRRKGAEHPLDESIAAWLVDGGEPVAVAEPRLSTTYDSARRQQRAGLELWMASEDEEGFPVRAAGELICATTLDLGPRRLEAAFFGWHMEGRAGVGRYDVLRHAATR